MNLALTQSLERSLLANRREQLDVARSQYEDGLLAKQVCTAPVTGCA
jgi:hypothetical protein